MKEEKGNVTAVKRWG